MEFLLLFAVFILSFGLLNLYTFLPRTKLAAWLPSSLPFLFPSHTSLAELPPVEEGEEDVDDEGSLDFDGGYLESIFSTFDKDGDGFITVKELEESLKRLGLFVTDAEVVSMVERVDSNGDGLIDLGEFRELCAELWGGRAEEGQSEGGEVAREVDEEMSLREAFGVFDNNKDGLITAEELSMVLTSLGLKQETGLEDCRSMIRRVDKDGDGKVNFDEFKKMMKMKGRKAL